MNGGEDVAEVNVEVKTQGKTMEDMGKILRATLMLYTVLFTLAVSLMANLKKASQEGKLDERLTFYSKPKLLIVDELGYLPLERESGNLFFQLVSRRYEHGGILLTSNRSVGEWGDIFGDNVLATAILDRLLHHSTVVTIQGESYRLMEKCRSGLLRKRKLPSPKYRDPPGGVNFSCRRWGKTIYRLTRNIQESISQNISRCHKQPVLY